jgi:hypothetical protein
MAWFDLIGSLSELANQLKDYLWSWVDGIAKYWVQTLAATRDYVQSLYQASMSYIDDWKDWLYMYINQVQNDLWKEAGLIWDRIGALPVITIEVVKGWVTPWLETVKVYAENLVSNLGQIYDRIITELMGRISRIEQWVVDSPDWLISTLYTQKDRVEAFIANYFEEILDRIFKEGED